MSPANKRRTLIDLTLLLGLSLLAADSVLAQKAQKRPTGRKREITFKISVPLKFKGRAVSGSLRKSEIPRLLDLPVRNGDANPNEGYGMEMTRPDGEKFTAYTCLQWEKARSEEAYAASTFDMAMESSMIHTCGLLIELQRARLPLKSFVANPKVSLPELNLLPAKILAYVPQNDEEEMQLSRSTVSEVVAKDDIEQTDDKMITLSYGGFRQSIWEAARADFDGDGVEDILVFTAGRAEGGTMGFSDYFLLTRTSPTGPLKLIENRNSK
jgi:hypothetical protein